MRLIIFFRDKVSKLMILAVAIFILGGVITFYQSKLNKIYVPDKVTVVVAENTIQQGHVITGSDLVEKKVYDTDNLKNSVNRMSDLIGKVALTTIVKGKEITPQEIVEKNEFFKETEREVGIKFAHFTDIVGGKGNKGDVVDIMGSFNKDEYGVRDEVCVVPGKEILNLMNEDNIEYENCKEKNSFKPLTAIFRLTNEEELLVDKAMKEGRVYLRRHGNYIKSDKNTSNQNNSESADRVIITGQ